MPTPVGEGVARQSRLRREPRRFLDGRSHQTPPGADVVEPQCMMPLWRRGVKGFLAEIWMASYGGVAPLSRA